MNDVRKEIEYAYEDIRAIMTSDKMWDGLLEDIKAYSKTLCAELGYEVSSFDALYAYHENIFIPVKNELDSFMVRILTRKVSLGKVYLAIATRWSEMMKEDSSIYANAAVHELIYTTSTTRFKNLLKRNTTKGDNDFKTGNQAA